MNAYDTYVKNCKAPKSQVKVTRIVKAILELLRQGASTDEMAIELNRMGVRTIQDKHWTYYSLQMQICKMARQDNDSSLAWALSVLINNEEASACDLALLKSRCRTVH